MIIFARRNQFVTILQNIQESRVLDVFLPIDGDLDPSISRHPLVSLKIAYKRLRLLVDMGCIFVGHDLRKDCRTISKISG
jgi:hypothetical protein